MTGNLWLHMEFPRSFLLVFAQLAVGGFLSLAIPPFHEIGRGYYKSTAAVYLSVALLVTVGQIVLSAQYTTQLVSPLDLTALFLWLIFVAAGGAYLASLWGDRFALRARLFAATWLVGLSAVALTGSSYSSSGALSAEAVIYPITFLVSALPLGIVSSAMLLGHWYLIDRDLSLEPFRRMVAFYAASLAVQVAVLGLATAILLLAGTTATQDAFQRLAQEHLPLLAIRLTISPLAAGVLGVMIWRTLQIPQTMAATGLSYVAILAVLVGEALGRFILFRTGLPL